MRIRLWRNYDGPTFRRMLGDAYRYHVIVLGKFVIAWETPAAAAEGEKL